MTAEGLYEDHWLLAYEAHEQGWLPTSAAVDYVAQDELFSILRTNNVRFYGTELSPVENEFQYWEGDDDEPEEIPLTDEDEE